MFENYQEMGDAEKASVKEIHKAFRARNKSAPDKDAAHSRLCYLAWGFVRGIPYRRIERSHRMTDMVDGSHYGSPAYAYEPYVQVNGHWMYEHNLPSPEMLTAIIGELIPGFAEASVEFAYRRKAHPDVVAWLKNREGAVPAPVREKKPYVRRVA